MKISTKITFAMLLLTVFAVGSVGGVTFWLARSTLRDSVLSGLQNTATLKARNIEDRFSLLREDTQIIQDYYNIRTNLPIMIAYCDDRDHAAYLEARRTLDGQLQAWLRFRSEVSNLALLDLDGRVVYSVDPASATTRLDERLPTLAGGDAACQGQTGIHVTEVFESPRVDLGYELLICAPVHDYAGRLVGEIVLEVDTGPIFAQVLDRTGLGATGETLVAVRRDDHALFLNPLRHDPNAALHRRADFGDATALPMQAAVQGERGRGVSVDYRDEPVVAAWCPLPQLGWGMVAKIDRAEAFAPLDAAAWLITLASVLGLVLTGVLALLVSRPLSRGLRSLVAVTRRSRAGDLSLRAELDSDDEIGELAAVFNDMLGSFGEVVEQAKSVASGDYTTRIEPRGERDELAHALRAMTRRLEQTAEAAEAVATGRLDVSLELAGDHDLLAQSINRMVAALERSTALDAAHLWTARSRAEFHAALAHDASVEELCARAVAALAGLLEVDRAALWIDEDGELRALGRWASAPGLEHHDAPGAGVVAEVLARREVLVSRLVTSPSEGGPKPGLGEPEFLVSLPALHEGEARGALVLTSSRELPDSQLEFLVSVMPTLGLAIAETEARARVATLLEEAKTRNHELHEVRAELEREAERLAQTSRYKSEFLANVCHELRSPLNGLMLSAKLLDEDMGVSLSVKQTRYLQTVLGAGAELAGLTDELLDLSRIEAGKLALDLCSCPLSELVTHLRQSFEPLAERRGLEFEVRVDPSAPFALCSDPKRLQQVLRNLVGNAIKYTAQGSVRVDIARAAPGPDEAGDRVAFVVSDTGVGIPADKQILVFEAFEQLTPLGLAKYGVGLGLSISRELADLLGGELELESEAGSGSTFTLYLPLVPSTELRRSSAKQAPPPKPKRSPLRLHVVADIDLRGQCVLVIDDDVRSIFALRSLLERYGARVIHAERGADALELLTGPSAERPSVVFVDLMMPGMTGIEFIQEIRARGDLVELPIFVVSGLAVPDAGQACLDAGATGYMTKPVDPAALLERLASALLRADAAGA